jgi:hypothetical protein
MTDLELATARLVARQARSFCYQFTEGAISLSEFLFAAIALEALNHELVNKLHHEPKSEWGL